MKLAWAEVCINPRQPVRQAGFWQQVHPVLEVKDDLHAYVLAFRDDHQTLIQIAVDSLGLPLGVQEQVERAAEGVLGTKTHLIISCTHTHFAPDGTDAAYQKQLVRCLNEAVASLRFEECSQLAYTLEQEHYDGLGRSRISSHPAEHITLSLIGIWKDGRRWASLVCYNCHPTVLNGDTPYFSAEYPGEALRILHKRHPQEHFLFLQGAAGDISTRFTRLGQDYPSMQAMAARFAKEAEQLHSRSSRLQDISAISCRQKRIDLLHDIGRPEPPMPARLSEREKETIAIGRKVHIELALHPQDLARHELLSVFCLGCLKLVYAPNELFSWYAGCCPAAVLVCYSSGYLPYVTEPDFQGLTYEWYTDTLSAASKTLLVETLQQLGQ